MVVWGTLEHMHHNADQEVMPVHLLYAPCKSESAEGMKPRKGLQSIEEEGVDILGYLHPVLHGLVEGMGVGLQHSMGSRTHPLQAWDQWRRRKRSTGGGSNWEGIQKVP
jgi:hypothetical protein